MEDRTRDFMLVVGILLVAFIVVDKITKMRAETAKQLPAVYETYEGSLE